MLMEEERFLEFWRYKRTSYWYAGVLACGYLLKTEDHFHSSGVETNPALTGFIIIYEETFDQ